MLRIKFMIIVIYKSYRYIKSVYIYLGEFLVAPVTEINKKLIQNIYI
jgi:hypothetical protein